jgi:hypothetical protein
MIPEAAPPGISSEISMLIDILGSKLDNMVDTQAVFNQQLVNIILDAVRPQRAGAALVSSPPSAKTYYAVVVGRQQGIFTPWKDVTTSIHGFAGAKMKRFWTRATAQVWYNEQIAILRSRSDEEYDSDTTYNEPTTQKPKGISRAGPVPPVITPPLDPGDRGCSSVGAGHVCWNHQRTVRHIHKG